MLKRTLQLVLLTLSLISIGPLAMAQTTCTYGQFAPNNWPCDSWKAYESNSVWKARIPSHPILAMDSAQIVLTLVRLGTPFVTQFTVTPPGGTPSTHDIAHPTFYSKSTDPLYTVGPSSCGSSTNAIGQTVRIPTAARPAGGVDGHMTVIDQNTNKEWDFFNFPRGGVSGGGTLVTGGHACWVENIVSGSGLISHTTAAHFDNFAGMVRGEELAAGHIDHPLFLVAGCVDDSGGVYPATINKGGFHQCGRSGGTNVGAPPAGALYWLDYTDAEIAALPGPAWEKTIATALAHYGGYVGDTGGGAAPNLGFRFEGATTYSVYGANSPVVKVAIAAGIPFSSGNSAYQFAPTHIDWANHLHVLDQCVARGLTGQQGGCVP